MSAIIRQQLKSILPALSADIDHGEELGDLANDPSSLDSISVGTENLFRKITSAQALLEKWTLLLASPVKEIREEENALFANFEIEGKSPSDIILEGNDILTKLEIKIDRIRSLAPPVVPVPPSAPVIRPLVNLPALQLPDFDGHEGNWPSFWAAFEHTIHNNSSLTGAQKLTYLVGRLRSCARTLVDGFALTDHNYPIVIDLLKGRFGDENKRADKLRSELFHLPKPTGHSTSLRAFSENVDRICRQLESLGSDLDNNPFLTVAIKEKLPTEIKAQLYDKEMEEEDPWTSKQWRERLARVVKLKEAVHAPWDHSTAPPPPQPHKQPFRQNEPIRRAFPVVAEAERGGNARVAHCSLCLQNGHKPSNCPTYRTVEQRKARLLTQGRCSVCAREGHQPENCSSRALCFRCGRNHHLLVCPDPEVPARGSNSVPLGSRAPAAKMPQFSSSVALPQGDNGPPKIVSSVAQGDVYTDQSDFFPESRARPTAYLMVQDIFVFNHKGSSPVAVPVFFDPGSQPSFISAELASTISPKLIANENMAVGGFVGSTRPKIMQFASPLLSVLLRRTDGEWENVELNQTNKIIPPVEYLKEVYWNPKDELKMGVAIKEPQILLGVREFWKFFLSKRETVPGLFRVDTVFGTMFGGEMDHFCPKFPVLSACNSMACGAVVRAENPEELVKKMWSLESLGITDPTDSNDDELASLLFRDSVKFRKGRYEVGWPWRPGSKDRLPDNFSLAYSRLSFLSKKLLANSDFREKYQTTINDQLKNGIIEPSIRTGGVEHFIPHHAVVTPKKLRVVYDASAHEKGKPSLNELLFPGPNLVADLAGILLRFRASAYPVLADIEKAFLAVGLRDEDREVAKFLWLKDPSQPLCPQNLAIFRFKRIAFGVSSSPYLLAAVLRHHLSSLGSPLGMEQNFYIDNLLLCSESVEEATSAACTARQVMASAGMHLREFVAADPSILRDFPADAVLVGDEQRVLGISWNLAQEKLIFEFPNANAFPPTRRGVLSTIASLFDPLGLCSPCVVKAKIFFQSLWDLGTGWDDSIGEKHEKAWKAIISEWNEPPLTFPRYTPCGQAMLQLHIFSDAGPNAFSAAVYLRAEQNGHTATSLLFSKSRLRPKKFKNDGLTIPRLELLGLITAVRAKNFVAPNYSRPFEKVIFWVDSQIVLSWLANNSTQPVFIANRLAEIRREKNAVFRYVRSADNPADLGTRGASPNELRANNLWHFGPEWLKLSENEWPNEYREITMPSNEPTVPESDFLQNSASVFEPSVGPSILKPRNFSSWSKLLATTTFVLYFLFKLLGKSEKLKRGLPFLAHLERAEPSSWAARTGAKKWLLKREQSGMAPENDTILGTDGLIRLRTRFALANQPDDFKNPIILPRESWITRLLIFSAHGSLAHAGVDFTLAKFLSEFWCSRPRRLIKLVLRDCPICKKDKAVKFSLPKMPPLPPVRTNPSPPFTFVGLDYLGPTQFKSPEGTKKAWVLLFTCLSCRAVHLELVDSLSAMDFLSAFRRFVARRGIPKRVWSDNGTQLVLGRQLLMAYYDFPAEWKLIPPRSPWAGGIYERMVGLVKTAFRRSLGRFTPTWVQLLTLTHEIEAILNSRPITFVSDQRDGPLPLRPVDFLAPGAQNSVIEPEEPDKPFLPSSTEKLAHLWYVTNEALRRFWQIWSREYLLLLRSRNQDTHSGPRVYAPETPKMGDIVLVEQTEIPRNHWPLGRIISLSPPDKPRSAKLMMGRGREWERPVNQLVPLEGAAKWAEVQIPQPCPKNSDETRGELAGEEQSQPKPPRVTFKWADRPPLPSGPSFIMRKEMPPRSSAAAIIPFFATLLMMLAFCGTGHAAPRILSCEELGIRVFLNPQAENALVCCEGICSSRGQPKPYLLPLPSDLLSSGYECHISYEIAGERISSKIQCEPIEGCNLIKCYLCWERLLNPHCSPFLIAFTLGSIAGAIGMLFIIVFCCLWSLRKNGLRWHWVGFPGFRRKSRNRRRSEPAVEFHRGPIINEIESEGENEILFRHRELEGRLSQASQLGGNDFEENATQSLPRGDPHPRRLTRLGYALAPPLLGIMIWLLLSLCSSANAGLEVVSVSANTEECTVDHGGIKCHFNSVTSLTLLPVGQRVELVFHTPHTQPMGSLFFALNELSLQCAKESRLWTRSYRVNMSTILRCPAAGSCSGSFCSDLEPHQSVPELSENFPGLNFCQEASGFIRRGCLSPAYACLFYRFFAKPTSSIAYELFKCPTWQFHIKLGLKLELDGTTHVEEIILSPGITHNWPVANLSLIFSPSALPPFPFLGGTFIANGTHAALVSEWQSHLRCPSKLSADNLKCTLSQDACHSCYVHHEAAVIKCHCLHQNLEEVMSDPRSKLPNSFGQLAIHYNNGQIRGSFPYSPINLIVKMDNTRLAIQHSPSKCTITPGRMLGCHSCRTGGRFNYSCMSTQGESFASIECADGTMWVTRCTPKGHPHAVVLSWDHPEIKTHCQVDCLGEKTTFDLEGTLVFFVLRDGDYSMISSTKGGKGIYTGGVTFPQIQLALFRSVGSLPQALLAMVIFPIWIIGFLLAIRYCPLSCFTICCCPQAAVEVAVVRAGRKSLKRTPNPNSRARTM